MKASPIAVALALASAACTVSVTRHTRPDTAAPMNVPAAHSGSSKASAARIDPAYELLTPEFTGLTRVADDGHRTVLSFASAPPAGLMIFDDNGKALPFRTEGEMVIIEGVRRGWLIRTPTRLSYAQTRTPGRVARLEESGAEGVNSSVLPADLAAARAGVLSAQQRLAGLSEEIDKASRGDRSAPLASLKGELEEIQTELEGIHATLVRTHFASGSALLVLSEEARGALVEAARRAESVQIKGATDSTGSEAVNVRIALARADAVRALLFRGGVEPEKVTTSSSTHDYVATNATAAGRASNRRVDVFFLSANGEAIPVASAMKGASARGPEGGGSDRARADSETPSSTGGSSTEATE